MNYYFSPPFLIFPNVFLILSGVWKDLAKLVICYVMLMGRHRGLPENIDHAVRLPEEVTFEKETIVASKYKLEITNLMFQSLFLPCELCSKKSKESCRST